MIWFRNPTSGYTARGNENRILAKYLYFHIYCTLFTIAKIWKQPKCPSRMNGWRSGEIYIYIFLLLFSCQVVSDSVTPWTAARQASLSLTISWSLPQFMSVASMMPSSHLILWHPLFPPPSIFASIRDFSNELAIRIRWPSNHFTLSINPSSDYSGLISLKIDWFDFLVVQGTFRSLLQHCS